MGAVIREPVAVATEERARPRAAKRIEGVDVARGVASLIMIQGHAYDGWVAAEHKASAAYAFTRLLGSLPLPAFLLLAGAAVVLRVDAAIRRGEDAGAVRRAVVWRGATVLGYGYLSNAAYALMDGAQGLGTLLRADVLHVIGLSIMALGVLGIRGAGAPRRASLSRAAVGLAVVPTLLCPWLSGLGAEIGGPARFAAALFVDVPGVTQMPFVPLASWLAIGALVAIAMLHARAREGAAARSLSGAPDGFFLGLGALGLGAALLGGWGTGALVEALGGTLRRAHPAVWLNVLDLAGRGLVVLAVAALLSTRVPRSARRALVRLGQGSLLAYVFHIPFCYGRLGALARGRLDMLEATLLVLALMAASAAVVALRDAWRAHRVAG